MGGGEQAKNHGGHCSSIVDVRTRVITLVQGQRAHDFLYFDLVREQVMVPVRGVVGGG
jgi:hypothetical protein